MLLPHGTIVALVDGEKFELFRNSGSDSRPTLSAITSPQLDEHNKGSGARHHASAAEPSGHQLKEDAHAAAVVNWLNHQVASNAIQDLVVIAPSRTLGEMRRHYSERLRTALRGDFDKEAIGDSGHDVLDVLSRRAAR